MPLYNGHSCVNDPDMLHFCLEDNMQLQAIIDMDNKLE